MPDLLKGLKRFLPNCVGSLKELSSDSVVDEAPAKPLRYSIIRAGREISEMMRTSTILYTSVVNRKVKLFLYALLSAPKSGTRNLPHLDIPVRRYKAR
jgi:hypothetical protein